jgi:hypothetical protein
MAIFVDEAHFGKMISRGNKGHFAQYADAHGKHHKKGNPPEFT